MLPESFMPFSIRKQSLQEKPTFEEYYPMRLEKWRNKVSTGVHLGPNKFIRTPKVIKQDDSFIDSAGFSSVHYHAIVVPYRNRKYHLEQFKLRMDSYIEDHYDRTNTRYSLWIIEQDDDEPFNRGWLANVGISEIVRHTPEVECLTFHDVDLVPDIESKEVKGAVYYSNCSVPTQVGSELFREALNWTIGYKQYTGGVVNMHLKHWRAINGFSNDYISWGGEDDDLYLRLHNNDLLSVQSGRKRLIRRPPTGYGRFRVISEAKEHHIQDRDKGNNENYNVSKKILQRFREVPQRSSFDGLSDLQYKVTYHHVVGKKQGFEVIHHVKAKQQLLEFIPIPNSGGNALIAQAGAKIGIPWGICHFREPSAVDDMDCPQPYDFQNIGLNSEHGEDLWRIPPHLWNINMFLGKDTFTVVRNPFDLMVAIFQDIEESRNASRAHSTTALNKFVHTTLCQRTENAPKFLQHEYVPYNGTQRGNHVLRFENLTSDYSQLMRQYGLPADLDQKAYYNTTSTSRLTIRNLTERSKKLIQLYFDEDFRRFKYPLEYNTDGLLEETAPICTSPLP
eukprot:scaffold9308_cov115-Cylindrotheca_fusiformis.AAC.11